MAIETALAKGSLDVTSRRDPEKIYHRMPVKQLVDMNPAVAVGSIPEGDRRSGRDTKRRSARVLQATRIRAQTSQPG